MFPPHPGHGQPPWYGLECAVSQSSGKLVLDVGWDEVMVAARAGELIVPCKYNAVLNVTIMGIFENNNVILNYLAKFAIFRCPSEKNKKIKKID